MKRALAVAGVVLLDVAIAAAEDAEAAAPEAASTPNQDELKLQARLTVVLIFLTALIVLYAAGIVPTAGATAVSSDSKAPKKTKRRPKRKAQPQVDEADDESEDEDAPTIKKEESEDEAEQQSPARSSRKKRRAPRSKSKGRSPAFTRTTTLVASTRLHDKSPPRLRPRSRRGKR